MADDFDDEPLQCALSSFTVGKHGGMQVVSSIVKANESGACWVTLSPDGRFAYVTNTVSSTISRYLVDQATGIVQFQKAFSSPIGPTEMYFTADGHFLYVLNPDEYDEGPPGLTAYKVNVQTGDLTPLPGLLNLPTSIDALIVR